MKKLFILALIIILFTGVFSVSAESLPIPPELLAEIVNEIGADFGLLLDGLGSDVDTILLQNAMAGQNIGMSELGDGWFSTFYIGLPAISVTASNGFLTFMNDDDYFKRLDLKKMLNDMALSELYNMAGPDNAKFIDTLLEQAFPFPAIKLNGGFKLPGNLELMLNGMFVPEAVLGLIPADLPAGLTMSYINAGGVLRYVLLRDSEDTPGMSIGLGGYYNNVKLGMSLVEMLEGQFDTGDDTFSKAGMNIGASVIAFGLDVALSKRLIGFFIPYIKLGAWYGITDVGGDVTLMEDVSVTSSAGHNDLDLLLDTGFDLALGPFIMNLGGNYNLGSGVWGVNLGSRLQF